jgi:hypothetical protein
MAVEECASKGCYQKNGQLLCEFYPRRRVNDTAQRTKLTSGKRNLTAVRWKMMCDGERRCQWQVNYTFNIKTASYKLKVVSAEHDGHRFDLSSDSVSRILVIGDVTEGMWTNMCQWVSIPLGGHKLRKVSIMTLSYSSHTYSALLS